MKHGKYVVLVLISILFIGCPVIDDFDGRVVINDDGSYDVEVSGRIIDYQAALQRAAGEPITAEDDESIQQQYSDIQDDPGFESFEYVGEGVFSFEYRRAFEPGEDWEFLGGEHSYMSVVSESDRIIARLHEIDDATALGEADLEINGTWELETSLPVNDHNARSERGRLSGGRVFQWEFGPDNYSERYAVVTTE